MLPKGVPSEWPAMFELLLHIAICHAVFDQDEVWSKRLVLTHGRIILGLEGLDKQERIATHTAF
jgi:hypothetical protein